MSIPTRSRDGWGPHDNPYDEDYEWWVDAAGMVFQGHLVEVECLACGADAEMAELVEGQTFHFVCEGCDDHLDVSPVDAPDPTTWAFHVNWGQPVDAEWDDDRVIVRHLDAAFAVTSATLFEDLDRPIADDQQQLKTDGGTDQEPVSIGLFAHWHKKAAENVQEWGLQDAETLLLAMQEELGELTQAYLEGVHENGDPERIPHEMDDLGALLLQLHMRLRRDNRDEGGEDDGE